MLPKTQRLSKKGHNQLNKKAKVFKNKLFLVKTTTLNQGQHLSVLVPKKVIKGAVERNRLRRFGYNLLKKFLPMIKNNTSTSFTFLAIPKDGEEIVESLEFILKKSSLIK